MLSYGFLQFVTSAGSRRLHSHAAFCCPSEVRCQESCFTSVKVVPLLHQAVRRSSSSTRWKTRQGRDSFARDAKVQGLKSRAAFKLLEIDSKFRLFKRGQTVVDLGYAPGSWSQVAIERTKPGGRVIGIDIIPAQPPKGVSTIQGNFLNREVQEEVKRFLSDPDRGRSRQQDFAAVGEPLHKVGRELGVSTDDEVLHGHGPPPADFTLTRSPIKKDRLRKDEDGRMVDIVLSDMCEPWLQTEGFWKRSLSDPYFRMMNTSGINFKDHAGSMDLCAAALRFAFDTLRVGGHFVCKFYQGGEDRLLESQLKQLFAVVHREKPESSRSESKEGFFVALRRKKNVRLGDVFAEDEMLSFPEETERT